ncbi:hypothetical protein CTI14_02760 [Methylobacterium radiotolerans]|nr:hypothetical protein CTI14_02760 [Methylobacterium radiotolerans]
MMRQRPNQLMLLGLLGTVMGLSLTIGNFAPQMQNSLNLLSSGQSPDSLNKDLATLLEHMKVAFVCTLWGVATSLIVTRFALLPLIERRELLQRRLEQFVMFQLTPLAWNTAVQREEAMLRAFENNRTELALLHTTLANQLDIFKEQTNLAARALTTAGKDLNAVASNATQAAWGAAQASEEASRTLKQVSTSLISSELALNRSTGALENNIEALTAQQTAYESTHAHVLGMTGEHARDLGALVNSFNDGTTRMIGGLQENTQRFEAARAELLAHTSKILEAQQQVGAQFTDSTSGLFDQVRQVVQEHQAAAQAIDQELRKVAEALLPLEALTERLDPTLLPVERWTAFQQGLEDLASRWNTWQGTFSQQLTTLLDVNGSTMLGDARTHAQEVQQQLVTTAGEVTHALGTSLERWNTVYADLAQHTAGTLHGQMSVASQLQRDHDELRHDLKQVAENLKTLVQQIASAAPKQDVEQTTPARAVGAPRAKVPRRGRPMGGEHGGW